MATRSREFQDSTSVKRASYDDESHVLYIYFIRGDTYRYFDVENDVVDELFSANSVGRFVAKNIARSYKYEKV